MRKSYEFSKGKRGAVLPSRGKTRITIMLDDDVLDHFRAKAQAQGSGYQTLINAALREALVTIGIEPNADREVTVAVLRKVLREELRAV